MSTSRRIVANYFVSLDGVVESPDKWHFPYFDDEMGGARLFPDGTPQQPLTLAESTAFGSGVLHLIYRPTAA